MALDDKTKQLLEELVEKGQEMLRQQAIREESESMGLIEKEGSDYTTGVAQTKQRITQSKKDHGGAGAGLGAIIGAGAGALSKKRTLGTALGGLIGGLAGKALGKRTVTRSETRLREGGSRKQKRQALPSRNLKISGPDVAKILKK